MAQTVNVGGDAITSIDSKAHSYTSAANTGGHTGMPSVG